MSEVSSDVPMSGVSMRNAATLLLVREGAAGLEVFMVERPGAADFGGMHVFPGGKVDEADASAESLSVDLNDALASSRLGVARGGLSFWIAAIRESFEEAGVLLANKGDGLIDFSNPATRGRFSDYRSLVHRGELSLIELCKREDLRLATDRVHYFSHWITPQGPPRRYDTRFFLAHMPHDQEGVHHAGELEDGLWIPPGVALDYQTSGRWKMIFPTLTTLRTLARYNTVDSLEADVRAWRHLPEVTEERHRQGMQPAAR